VIALDTSALAAIAFDEPERAIFAETIAAQECLIGLPTAFETHMVFRRDGGSEAIELLRDILREPNVQILEFTRDLFVAACEAFDRYGKGRHRAALNFGDCMSYAVAKARDVPLLFKGNDFSFTDITPAAP
jgi:ribonuclease VapC